MFSCYYVQLDQSVSLSIMIMGAFQHEGRTPSSLLFLQWFVPKQYLNGGNREDMKMAPLRSHFGSTYFLVPLTHFSGKSEE